MQVREKGERETVGGGERERGVRQRKRGVRRVPERVTGWIYFSSGVPAAVQCSTSSGPDRMAQTARARGEPPPPSIDKSVTRMLNTTGGNAYIIISKSHGVTYDSKLHSSFRPSDVRVVAATAAAAAAVTPSGRQRAETSEIFLVQTRLEDGRCDEWFAQHVEEHCQSQ